jgi:hypothetical protein
MFKYLLLFPGLNIRILGVLTSVANPRASKSLNFVQFGGFSFIVAIPAASHVMEKGLKSYYSLLEFTCLANAGIEGVKKDDFDQESMLG